MWQGGFMIEAGIALAFAYTFFRIPARIAAHIVDGPAEHRCGLCRVLRTAAQRRRAGDTAATGDIYRTLAGERFNPSELEGQPVVINLWATWCPPCRREMPMMADVAANTDAAELVFVNQGEGQEIIQRYLTAENLELEHVVLDGLGEFGRHYEVPGLPATLFLKSDGTLQSVHMGEISREDLVSGIQGLE
jgi:thiol-disulfide isomerase/thioredoxin